MWCALPASHGSNSGELFWLAVDALKSPPPNRSPTTRRKDNFYRSGCCESQPASRGWQKEFNAN
jgi:hypothetical protein